MTIDLKASRSRCTQFARDETPDVDSSRSFRPTTVPSNTIRSAPNAREETRIGPIDLRRDGRSRFHSSVIALRKQEFAEVFNRVPTTSDPSARTRQRKAIREAGSRRPELAVRQNTIGDSHTFNIFLSWRLNNASRTLR